MTAIDEIKKKIDIVDFIGSYVSVKKAGRNYKACCPFHSEKTPSFVISPDRQIWHCFGACNDGGDIVKFLMKLDGLTFYEALKILAEKAGVKLDNNEFKDKQWTEKEKLYKINNLANDYYHYILTKHEIGKTSKKYLDERKINNKIIDTFSLGYSPSSWDSLLNFLKKKGFNEQDILKTGLIVKSEKGKYFDRFRKRLMFPLKDINNNILGFSGRIIENDPKEAKYINTPETEIYHKRETLFGINLTKDNIRKSNSVIITEGEFDMISCFMHGIDNVVAVKGAAVTKEQLRLIKRYTNRLILCLDADVSGNETTKRAIIDAEELEFEITVLRIDFAKDPDEALKKDPIKFKQQIKKAIPIYDFIINSAIEKNQDNNAFAKKKIADEVVPFLNYIKNPIVKSYYVKKIADLLEVENKDVERLIYEKNKKIFSYEKKYVAFKKSNDKMERQEMLEKFMLNSIFLNENPFSFFDKYKNYLSDQDFYYLNHQKLFENFIEYQKIEKNKFDSNQFINFLPKELVDTFDKIILFDIEYFEGDLKNLNFEKIIFEIKKNTLKKKINEIAKKNDQNDDEIKMMQDLSQQLSGVEKKLNIL